MTDTSFASELIQDAFPVRSGRNVKAAIGDAFDALKRRERQLPQDVLRERPRQWTERRVRSLWFREARRVDHYCRIGKVKLKRRCRYRSASMFDITTNALIAAVKGGAMLKSVKG